MKTKQYRQGDLLIERVQKVTRKTKAKKLTRIVLADGEATGHAHALETKDPADWWKDGETQFVNLPSAAVVVHEEHSTVELEKGTYKVTRQREYSPEAIRNVAD